MGCNCGQRRALTFKAVSNLKQGDLQAAKANAAKIAQSMRVDARNLGRSIKTAVGFRTGR